MKKIFLSCILIIACIISQKNYAQSLNNSSLYVDTVNNLQKSMPRKATIDGKKIYNVVSNHTCSITVTMESSKKYQFSLITWPTKENIDNSGYAEFILQDTDNKPHILRTDIIKGKNFLTSIKNLIKNCQESTKDNGINKL